jgi:hypothetical protein
MRQKRMAGVSRRVRRSARGRRTDGGAGAPYLRGTIHPAETASAYYQGHISFSCLFDEFGLDSPLNRVLRAATAAVASAPILTLDLRRRARQALSRFTDVGQLRARRHPPPARAQERPLRDRASPRTTRSGGDRPHDRTRIDFSLDVPDPHPGTDRRRGTRHPPARATRHYRRREVRHAAEAVEAHAQPRSPLRPGRLHLSKPGITGMP